MKNRPDISGRFFVFYSTSLTKSAIFFRFFSRGIAQGEIHRGHADVDGAVVVGKASIKWFQNERSYLLHIAEHGFLAERG